MPAPVLSLPDLKEPPSRLRFPESLEVSFQADYYEKLIRIARPGTALTVLVYASFWILDRFSLPENYKPIWIIRLVGMGLMAGLFAFSFTPTYKRYVVPLFTLACVVISLSVVACFGYTHPGEQVYHLYFITLFFVLLGGPLLGLPFLSELLLTAVTLGAYLGVGIFQQHMPANPQTAVLLVASAFFLVGASAIGLLGGYFAERTARRDYLLRLAIEQERARSEDLLLNILPAPIAERLKRGEVVADHFECASVLFADIVNFTPLSAGLTPVELVGLLDEVFSFLDGLTEQYGLEKIKTIGDCYMVAAGTPTPRPDHALVLAQMALDIRDFARQRTFLDGRRLAFRIGIHSGSLVAGIIGRKKFIYDLWGDSVNTASRMESHGVEGVVQVTRATYELIRDHFQCTAKGLVTIKGKGPMEVWHIDRKPVEM